MKAATERLHTQQVVRARYGMWDDLHDRDQHAPNNNEIRHHETEQLQVRVWLVKRKARCIHPCTTSDLQHDKDGCQRCSTASKGSSSHYTRSTKTHESRPHM